MNKQTVGNKKSLKKALSKNEKKEVPKMFSAFFESNYIIFSTY